MQVANGYSITAQKGISVRFGCKTRDENQEGEIILSKVFYLPDLISVSKLAKAGIR